MALTVVRQADPSTAGEFFVIGDRKAIIATVQFDSSYPTGGEVITAAELGFGDQIDMVIPLIPVAGTRLVAWDQSNKKLKVFTAISTEAANTSDQSSIIVPILAIGK